MANKIIVFLIVCTLFASILSECSNPMMEMWRDAEDILPLITKNPQRFMMNVIKTINNLKNAMSKAPWYTRGKVTNLTELANDSKHYNELLDSLSSLNVLP